jgi:pilus assembly protein CpaE
VKDFAEAMGTEPLLVLPFDPQLFGTAANNGQMIAQLNAQSRAAQGFTHLAKLMTGREIQSQPKGKRDSLIKLLGGLRKPLKKAS